MTHGAHGQPVEWTFDQEDVTLPTDVIYGFSEPEG